MNLTPVLTEFPISSLTEPSLKISFEKLSQTEVKMYLKNSYYEFDFNPGKHKRFIVDNGKFYLVRVL